MDDTPLSLDDLVINSQKGDLVNDEELQALLDQLEQALTGIGLEFVVDQERALAQEGKPVPFDTVEETHQLRRYWEWEETSFDSFSTPGTRYKQTDMVFTPLKPIERLQILMDLTEVLTSSTLEMEQAVLRDISSFLNRAGPVDQARPQIVFSVPEEAQQPDAESPDRRLSPSSQQREAAGQALAIIDRLRAAIGVGRSPWLIRTEGGPN